MRYECSSLISPKYRDHHYRRYGVQPAVLFLEHARDGFNFWAARVPSSFCRSDMAAFARPPSAFILLRERRRFCCVDHLSA